MKGDRIFIMSRAYSSKARDEHERIFGKKDEPKKDENKK